MRKQIEVIDNTANSTSRTSIGGDVNEGILKRVDETSKQLLPTPDDGRNTLYDKKVTSR